MLPGICDGIGHLMHQSHKCRVSFLCCWPVECVQQIPGDQDILSKAFFERCIHGRLAFHDLGQGDDQGIMHRQRDITRAFVSPISSDRSSYVAFGLSFRYSTNLKPVRTGLDGSRSCRKDRIQSFCVIALLEGKEAGFCPFLQDLFIVFISVIAMY